MYPECVLAASMSVLHVPARWPAVRLRALPCVPARTTPSSYDICAARTSSRTCTSLACVMPASRQGRHSNHHPCSHARTAPSRIWPLTRYALVTTFDFCRPFDADEGSLYDLIADDTNLSILKGLIDFAGEPFVSTLKNLESNITVFAPTDEVRVRTRAAASNRPRAVVPVLAGAPQQRCMQLLAQPLQLGPLLLQMSAAAGPDARCWLLCTDRPRAVRALHAPCMTPSRRAHAYMC